MVQKVMSYSVSLDEAKNIVHVTYSGIANYEERVQAVEEVCKKFATVTPMNILVNVCELTMSMSFEEQERFGKYLSSHPSLSAARVAVLHAADYNPNLIVDVSAYNDGYTLAEFNNVDDAQDWLAGS